MRAVIYDDRRGGYIDNVPATFTRKNTDVGIHYAQFPAVNGAVPGRPAEQRLLRAARQPEHQQRLRRRTGDQPGHLPGHPRGGAVQVQRRLGRADHPVVPEHGLARACSTSSPTPRTARRCSRCEVTLFNPSFDKDKFESTAWTVNGKIGDLKAVYTGGYLVRNVEQVGDYTNYARGFYADYYQCFGPGSGYDNNLKSTCFSPSATWHSDERNTHQQHELRLSTPDDWRLRAIAGAFWEDNTLYDQTGWSYKTVPTCTSNDPAGSPGNTGCFADIGTVPGATVVNPGVQPAPTSFYQDTVRDDQADRVLRLGRLRPHSEGADAHRRHAPFPLRQLLRRAASRGSFGCFEGGAPAAGCHTPARISYNLNAAEPAATPSPASRAAATSPGTSRRTPWCTTPSRRASARAASTRTAARAHAHRPGRHSAVPGARAPTQSDKLTNNEIGWKTEFFDHRLQWNGAVYRENWDNVQVAFFDPGLVGNIFYNTNGQNFLIKGIETSLMARVITGLTVQGAGLLEPQPARPIPRR